MRVEAQSAPERQRDAEHDEGDRAAIESPILLPSEL
jgi:hypothetical protein